MFEISFFAAEAAFTAIWLLVRISIWIRQKSIDWKREAVLALMYINLAVIIRFVLFPRDLVDGHIQPLVFDAATAFPLRINPWQCGNVHSHRYCAAYCIQAIEQLMESSRSRCVHFTKH